VDQFAATRVDERLSLTAFDLTAIRAALPDLHGRWSLVTESGDERELYARLLPPWGTAQHSAFLLEREDNVVILTDNLSDPDCCRVSGFPNVVSAMEVVRRVVLGEGRR
jgi:hypothetical protein